MDVEVDLKKLIKRSDLTYKCVADELRVPYSTFITWLNGFSPLPSIYRLRTLNMISEREIEVQG